MAANQNVKDNGKISTGIVLPADVMNRLDLMAAADMRDRSAEIATLVNAEWERRSLETPTTPKPTKKS